MGQQALLVWVPKDTVMSSSIIHNRVCIVLCLVCAQFIGISGVQAQPRGPVMERAQPLRSCEHADERLSGRVVLQAGCFYEQSFRSMSLTPHSTVMVLSFGLKMVLPSTSSAMQTGRSFGIVTRRAAIAVRFVKSDGELMTTCARSRLKTFS